MCFKSAFLKGICHFLWNTDVLNLFSMNISMKMWTDGSISGHLTTKLHFWHQKRLLQNLGHFGFHPLPPDQNVLILNYKKLGFQVDPLPPFRPMSLNILFFLLTPSLSRNKLFLTLWEVKLTAKVCNIMNYSPNNPTLMFNWCINCFKCKLHLQFVSLLFFNTYCILMEKLKYQNMRQMERRRA